MAYVRLSTFGEHVDVRIDLIRSPIVDPIGAAPEQ